MPNLKCVVCGAIVPRTSQELTLIQNPLMVKCDKCDSSTEKILNMFGKDNPLRNIFNP